MVCLSTPRDAGLLVALGLATLGGACAERAVHSPRPAVEPSLSARPSTSTPVLSGNAQADASVENRAQQYWARRQAKDLAGAYPFYCAAYRSRVSLGQFQQLSRLIRFDLLAFHVAGTEAAGDRIEVTIAYRFLVPTLPEPEVNSQMTETWARDTDGQWCKEDEPVVMPFPQAAPSLPPGAATTLRATHNKNS